MPDIQHPSHGSLDAEVAEECAVGQRTHHVVVDELKYFFVVRVPLQRRVLDIGLHPLEVVVSLAFQSRLLSLLIGWQVFQEDLPCLAAIA